MNLTPIQYLQSVDSSLTLGDCKSLLGRMSLKRTDVGDPTMIRIENLSGGQKARVAFAKIAIERPHVILFDEPTNHLDYKSIQGLIYGINNFNGGVIIISHDIYLIRSIERSQLFIVDNEKVTECKENFDFYYRNVLDTI